jgi:hypothetical protein
VRTSPGERRLLLMIFYRGPWARLADFCFGLPRDPDKPLRWEIPADPSGWRWVLQAIGSWAEMRDAVWRAKYAAKRKSPSEFWRAK